MMRTSCVTVDAPTEQEHTLTTTNTPPRTPESVHAEQRGPVRFVNRGRTQTGTLVYWPRPGQRRGRRACVIDGSGNWISVDPNTVELLHVEATA